MACTTSVSVVVMKRIYFVFIDMANSGDYASFYVDDTLRAEVLRTLDGHVTGKAVCLDTAKLYALHRNRHRVLAQVSDLRALLVLVVHPLQRTAFTVVCDKPSVGSSRMRMRAIHLRYKKFKFPVNTVLEGVMTQHTWIDDRTGGIRDSGGWVFLFDDVVLYKGRVPYDCLRDCIGAMFASDTFECYDGYHQTCEVLWHPRYGLHEWGRMLIEMGRHYPVTGVIFRRDNGSNETDDDNARVVEWTLEANRAAMLRMFSTHEDADIRVIGDTTGNDTTTTPVMVALGVNGISRIPLRRANRAGGMVRAQDLFDYTGLNTP